MKKIPFIIVRKSMKKRGRHKCTDVQRIHCFNKKTCNNVKFTSKIFLK